MSNKKYGHVGYGIVLLDDPNDESIPSAFLDFGKEGTDWKDELMAHLYPEGPPKDLEISCHYLQGVDKPNYPGQYQIPLLTIGGYPNYGITSSGDNPDDLTDFLKSLSEKRAEWDGLIREFITRCAKARIALADTTPHAILWLSWDSSE